MNTLRRLACGLLLAAAPLSAQDVSFGVQSNSGNTGVLCAPWSCTPRVLTASRGTRLSMWVMGAQYAPHFLLVSGPRAQCLALTGFGRSLIVRPPLGGFLVPLVWGKVYVTGPRPNCSGWWGLGSATIPRTVPTGTQFLMQMVAPHPRRPGSQLTFSNAVRLTIR